MQIWTPLIFRRFNINFKHKKRNRGRYRVMCLEQDEFGLGPCLLELSCVRVSLRAQFLLIAFGPLWVLVTHFQAHCQASSQGNPVVSSYTTPGKNAENKLLFLLLSLQKEIPFSLLYFWEKETSPKSVQKKTVKYYCFSPVNDVSLLDCCCFVVLECVLPKYGLTK